MMHVSKQVKRYLQHIFAKHSSRMRSERDRERTFLIKFLLHLHYD